jgi:hypothetical protein
MRFDEVRQAIIHEWLELPPDSRQSEQQAANFVTQAARRHAFDPAKDPFNLIMTWLDPYIPQRAGWLPPPLRSGTRITR